MDIMDCTGMALDKWKALVFVKGPPDTGQFQTLTLSPKAPHYSRDGATFHVACGQHQHRKLGKCLFRAGILPMAIGSLHKSYFNKQITHAVSKYVSTESATFMFKNKSKNTTVSICII